MTLVATLIGQGMPALMGDTLISSESESFQNFVVPTVGEIARVDSTNRFPSGMNQKLYIFGNDLAVGWAGKKIAAEVVISKLNDWIAHNECSPESLDHFFVNLPIQERLGVSVVGLIKMDNKLESFGGIGAETYKTRFGTVRVAGSGEFDLWRFIVDELSELIPSEDFNPDLASISILITASMKFLGQELLNKKPLLEGYYGGAYEFITYNQGKFEKLDGLTSIFWEAYENDNGWSLSPPAAIIKSAYQKEMLTIRAIRTEGAAAPDFSLDCSRDSVHVIPPFKIEPNLATLGDFSSWSVKDLNSRVLCHCVIGHSSSGDLVIDTRLTTGWAGSELIRFESEGNRIKDIIIKGELYSILLKGISRKR